MRKWLCWLLGHEAEQREWLYSPGPAKIMVPYCKHCDKCLTVLPMIMYAQEAWYKHYKDFPINFSPLYEEKAPTFEEIAARVYNKAFKKE